MFRSFLVCAVWGATLAIQGCASIVSGTNQSVSVTTLHQGIDVSGVKCSLTNDKGTWYTTTPGSVTVHRSFKELSVQCAGDGFTQGTAMVMSATKGMAFGNILFGGVIGAGVDISTGAAYDYPNAIVVTMGETTTVGSAPPRPLSAGPSGGGTAGAAGPLNSGGAAGCNPLSPTCRP